MKVILTFVVIALASSLSTATTLPVWTQIPTNQDLSERSFSFRVALKQQNLDILEQLLYLVSDPNSSHYGHHLSAEQISEIVKPENDVIYAVLDWLIEENKATCGLHASLIGHSDYIKVDTCVKRAQEILGLQLMEYKHPRAQNTILRSTEPNKCGGSLECLNVPSHLHPHIDMIMDVIDLPPLVKTSSIRAPARLGGEPGELITPPILKQLYNIDESLKFPTGTAQSSQAVAEFEEAYFYESDLDAFQANFSEPANPIKKIVGDNKPDQGYLGEASLDVQYMTTIADLDTWVFSQFSFDLSTWAMNVTSTPNAPKVHSVSWGSAESQFQATTMQRDNTEFMKMGAQGFTVLVASGDEGTGSQGWIFCDKFDPTFPATSPYVTAVGGTYVQDGKEITWKSSGGGFSAVFDRPSYQESQVQNYLNTASLPSAKYFNSKGRAIPDVAAAATNYDTLIEKYWGPMTGTSAATPVFAALLAMVNAKREQEGKSALGFVNPLLYSLNEGVGQDITEGENKASNCSEGFKATEGWDPATGLGTPNFKNLLNAIESALAE